jgi:hypothetical protein
MRIQAAFACQSILHHLELLLLLRVRAVSAIAEAIMLRLAVQSGLVHVRRNCTRMSEILLLVMVLAIVLQNASASSMRMCISDRLFRALVRLTQVMQLLLEDVELLGEVLQLGGEPRVHPRSVLDDHLGELLLQATLLARENASVSHVGFFESGAQNGSESACGSLRLILDARIGVRFALLSLLALLRYNRPPISVADRPG